MCVESDSEECVLSYLGPIKGIKPLHEDEEDEEEATR